MSELQKKLDEAKAKQAAQQKPEDKPQENAGEQKSEVDETKADDLDALVGSFGVEQAHPRAPIIMDEISEEEKAEALALAQANLVKPVGAYAYSVGSIFGGRNLVKLTPTPFGNFQSPEEIEATGTMASWEHLVKLGQAYIVE